jgi:hypothetical protein
MFDGEIEAEEIMLEAEKGVPGPFYDPISKHEMPGRKNNDASHFWTILRYNFM